MPSAQNPTSSLIPVQRSQITEHIAFVSILIFLIGIATTVASLHHDTWWGVLLADLGSALVATGTIGFFWNLLADRWTRAEGRQDMSILYRVFEGQIQATLEAFLKSHYELTEGSENFGLKNILTHSLAEAEITDGLAHSRELLLVCIVDFDWRERLYRDLVAFLENGSNVQVYMPDPGDDRLMEEVSARFDRNVTGDILALIDAFELASKNACAYAAARNRQCGTLALRLIPIMPSYTCYRFSGDVDNKQSNFGMLRLYGNTMPTGGRLPALKSSQPGLIWDFVGSDVCKMSDMWISPNERTDVNSANSTETGS